MPGGGTRLDIIPNNPPPARLLDLTRLVSRAGRTHTGVDRVEFAYLRVLCAIDTPLFGLVRTAFGYVLLDHDGCRALFRRVEARQWGRADLLSRLALRLPEIRKRAEADIRRIALARCRPMRLTRMLSRHLPPGMVYLNVGHSNLTERVLFAVAQVPLSRTVVLLHDTIPLDVPHFQRPGSPERFRALLRRVRHRADLVIYNSEQTRADAEHHMAPWGEVPPGLVAPLGLDPAPPVPDDLPAGLPPAAPYFVTLGTIEPRKNHALLLDIWDGLARDLGAECPRLVICGARGWNNEAVFNRLDTSPLRDRYVFEVPGLSDGAVAALLQGSAGLLFPSFAEGFGLPPVEAAAMGVPVACADLPVYREVLGDIPVYANPSDRYLWRQVIMQMAEDFRADRRDDVPTAFVPPSWDDHFKAVISTT